MRTKKWFAFSAAAAAAVVGISAQRASAVTGANLIAIVGQTNLQVRFELLNLFDVPNYTPVANPGTSATIFRTTSAYTDASNTYDPGGRIGMLSVRFNW